MKKTILTLSLITLISCTAFARETPQAIISIQKGELEHEVPFSLNLDGSNSTSPNNEKLEYEWNYPDNKIIKSKNPRSYKFEKPGTYEISLKVTTKSGLTDRTNIKITALEKRKSSKTTTKTIANGDKSEKIKFSEVMPNPKGSDSTKEWIELFNNDNKDINLKNWKITNSKSTFKIKNDTIIKSHDYLILENKSLKISLKNSNEKLQLVDYQGKIMDSLEYQNSIEGKSYSRILEQKWIWGEESKNKKNPTFKTIEGKILNYNQEEIIIKTTLNEETSIKIETPTQLFKTLLKEGVEGSFYINEDKNTLENFTIKQKLPPIKKADNKIKELSICLSILITSSLLLSWRYKSSLQHHHESTPIQH